jgi:hypothetical protein
MVSSSAGEGPGPLISRGFTERRIFRSSRASGNAGSFGGNGSGLSTTEISRAMIREKAL